MKISNQLQKDSKVNSKPKKKNVIIKRNSKRMISKEQSKSKERYNTLEDIKKYNKNKIDKKGKENYFDKLSKKKQLILKINIENNDKESYPYKKSVKKINKDKANKKYKDYPNLIKGVLGQAVYNNISNNTNYNEYIRYKPIGDIFKDQSDIPTRKITMENNNSLNISFNSKSDLIKKEKEKEKNDINNNINNTYNLENELKINADSIISKNNDTLIKSGRRISPILPDYNNINKKKPNKEIVSEYINNDKNDRNRKMNEELNNVEIKITNNINRNKKIKIEKIDNFNIQNIQINKTNNLSFKNDEEIWKYLKEKMGEEKEKEYNENKLKYNYFTLVKKFQGKILYEIGLENNINKINSILEKENVKVENEPVFFITKKSLNKINKEDMSDKEMSIKIHKINKENEILRNNINIMKEETEKLNDIINSLNEKIKTYEKEINSRDNIINKYQKEINELNFKYTKNKDCITLEIIKNEFFEILNKTNKQIVEKDKPY